MGLDQGSVVREMGLSMSFQHSSQSGSDLGSLLEKQFGRLLQARRIRLGRADLAELEQ